MDYQGVFYRSRSSQYGSSQKSSSSADEPKEGKGAGVCDLKNVHDSIGFGGLLAVIMDFEGNMVFWSIVFQRGVL